ncbi:hypothetical protein IG631_05102 [Alternaria alternata]|nr:hypothetical protein IG631_05102 [Alternaria alternata]
MCSCHGAVPRYGYSLIVETREQRHQQPTGDRAEGVSGRGVLLPCGSNPLQGWQEPVAWHTACRLMSCFNIRPPCPGGVLRKSIIFAVQDR